MPRTPASPTIAFFRKPSGVSNLSYLLSVRRRHRGSELQATTKEDSRRHCDKGVQSQCWRQKDTLLGHQPRRISIDHISMLNTPNTALDGVANAFGRITVCCDQGTSHIFLARPVSELQG